MLTATKIIRVRPNTKNRFDKYAGTGRTADRVINDMLDKMKVPK